MASAPWTEDEWDLLESYADRRDWIEDAMRKLPGRTKAALRSMMQQVRLSLGMSDCRSVDFAWMVDAANGSRRLLERLNETGLRP